MYFKPKVIIESIQELKNVHPFHGITFLACKQANLSVGKEIEFVMDSCTKLFLEKHHQLDDDSEWFFQPYHSIKRWVKPDYAASGLQAINTQTFGSAFIHKANTRIWAWKENYVEFLLSKLIKKQRLPAYHFAIWVYKDKNWPEDISINEIINRFKSDFHILDSEEQIFDFSVPHEINIRDLMQSEPTTWLDLQNDLSLPPDAKPDQGGTLAFLEICGLGPAEKLSFEPAKRLSLITGDNGLGKTFLLECAWWALTGVWPDRAAYPRASKKRNKTEISFSIEGKKQVTKKTILFDWNSLSWPETKNRPTIPGLIVYARVDGSFAVWDPAKQGINSSSNKKAVYSGTDVWNGLDGRIEGLIRDWVRWQNNPTKYPFEMFINVLKRLSPPDLGTLTPGEPIRIPDDPRDIPTICHPHGITPIVYSSAGVKRIITLAYLIVWAWNEHVIAAELSRRKSESRMVIIVDEMEAHLHPKWQREVLPALMSVGEMLSTSLETQFIVATHSPLVMASSESIFDTDIDALFHLDLDKQGSVILEEIDFHKFGDISAWLTSPVFDLKQARSKEAETAIESAKILQQKKEINREEVEKISSELIKNLGSDDKFWPRWISFAEKYGVIL